MLILLPRETDSGALQHYSKWKVTMLSKQQYSRLTEAELFQTCHGLDKLKIFFLRSRERFKPAYRDFQQSAQKGCNICLVIWRALFGFAKKLGVHEEFELKNATADLTDGDIIKWIGGKPTLLLELEGSNLGVYLFCTESDSIPGHLSRCIKTIPLLPNKPDSAQCFDQIVRWITGCKRLHPQCRQDKLVVLPTRVVDVNPTNDGLQPFAVETKNSREKYIALSYMWGEALPLTLTAASLDQFKSSIPWTKIPKTLQDAMIITHRLGLRYIWINALTITQDGPKDWEREATRKARVYGNAYLTIVAVDSKDCNYVIFVPRNVSIQTLQVWPASLGQPMDYIEFIDPDSLLPMNIYARMWWKSERENNLIQTRAWTF